MAMDALLQQFDEQGFIILEGVIPPGPALDAVRDAVGAAHDGHQSSGAAETEQRTAGHRVGVRGVTNLGMLPNYTSAWCEWLLEPRLQQLLGRKLGDDYRVSHCSALVNSPGCGRGYLHADWPYNGTNGSKIRPPYPDTLLAISSLWFLTEFSPRAGSTVVIPRSHRTLDNPADGHLIKARGIDPDQPYPGEAHVSGPAGSVLLWDSRLWHRVSQNRSEERRMGMNVSFVPWWLNLEPLRRGSAEHTMMVVARAAKNSETARLTAAAYAGLPAGVRPLFRHLVERSDADASGGGGAESDAYDDRQAISKL
eukprot:SAG22_NODE_1683_length_3817_cov_1.449704_1_plen_310_part_00